ncbi:LamB/YcsF family protein [Streptomyces sp. NBC_01210]|uniref:LamB/YcsF family protein n=1 Tax=Streptomyces sp. NBC_01210 TaxID=2903774 RepID=UPI002E0E29DD|nr:LamB/YcsF family protein [Streptomyces sp. NBC_01210]
MAAIPPVIDLNCDLGEGFGAWTMGDDDTLLDIVTSANVACGFHAGDPNIMRRVCRKAAGNGVAIGAHVGYRDLAGFGRRAMRVAPEDLINDVIYQIAALDGFARIAGSRVSYVKPHGALYNTVAVDGEQATALVEAVHRYDPHLAVLGLPDSRVLQAAHTRGLTGVAEAFADRAYDQQGRLVPRDIPGSVLHDVDAVVERCTTMVLHGTVTSLLGTTVTLTPRSLCVHGDTPGAAEMAREVKRALLEAGVTLSPFVEVH